MPTDLKQLSTYITEEEKQAFSLKAQELGYTSSMLMAHVVRTFLGMQAPVRPDKLPQDTGLKDGHVTINFRRSAFDALKARAKERGMKPATYLSALFIAHDLEQPYFSSVEIQALKEIARELAALGRNINQIAKAINITSDEIYQVKALQLEELKESITDTRAQLKEVVKANMASWGISKDG